MNKIFLIMAVAVMAMNPEASGQNLNSTNGGYAKTRKIDGKKFKVHYYEYEINKTMDEVWAEVMGNFVNVGQIHKSINESHCESGDVKNGEGAARFCSLDFGGKKIDIKERITEVTETANRKEYTYDVYETKGFPAKVYNTWVVRKDDNGKVYLGNAFVMRGKPAIMTGMMMRKLKKLGGVRNAVLAYKHYLETGEKKVDPSVFASLYPDM